MKYTTGFQELSRDLKKALEKITPKEALKIVEQEGNNLFLSLDMIAACWLVCDTIKARARIWLTRLNMVQ